MQTEFGGTKSGPDFCSGPVFSHPVFSHPVFGHQVFSHQVFSHQVFSHQVFSHPGRQLARAKVLPQADRRRRSSKADPIIATSVSELGSGTAVKFAVRP